MQSIWVPDVDFISDIITFQSTVIAIVFPLSLEVISRVSERYQSGIVTKEFKKQKDFYNLLILTTANLIFSLVYRFEFSPAEEEAFHEQLINAAWSYGNLTLALLTIIFLLRYINIIFKFITETSFLLNEFNRDLSYIETNLQKLAKKIKYGKQIEKALKSLSLNHIYALTRIAEYRKQKSLKKSKKSVYEQQKETTTLFSGIGDILEFELRQKQNKKIVKENIDLLRYRFCNIVMEINDCQEIKEIFFYTSELRLQEGDIDPEREFSLSLLLNWQPEKYLVVLNSLLEQSLRLYKVSIESRDYDFAIEGIIYSDINLLQSITCQKLPEHWATVVFRYLDQYSRLNSSLGKDLKVDYCCLFSWYDSIVFIDDFNIDFLSIFGRNLNKNLKHILMGDEKNIFKSFASSIFNSSTLSRHFECNFEGFLSNYYWGITSKIKMESDLDYYRKKYDISIRHLEDIENDLSKHIRGLSDLENISSKINKFSREIESDDFYKPIEQELIQELDLIKKKAKYLYKLDNLKLIFFEFSAFAIFKEKFDFLDILLNYKQPLDSEAHWCGGDIFPSRLPNLLDFYVVNPIAKTMYWEDHHGSEQYFDLFFLILLLREFVFPLQNDEYQKQKISQKIDSFNLEKINSPIELDRIRQSVSLLLKNRISLLHTKLDCLSFLNVNFTQLRNGIDDGITVFFSRIINGIEQKLQKLETEKPLSSEKVNSLYTDFREGYHSQQTFKDILHDLGLYKQKSVDNYYPEENFIYLLNRFEFRSRFFDEWFIYFYSAKEYGDNVRQIECNFIINLISKQCEFLQEKTLSLAIQKSKIPPQNLVIFTNTVIDRYMGDNVHFLTRNQNFNAKDNLRGYFEMKDHSIPIYQYPFWFKLKNCFDFCFLIDINNFSQLIQYLNPCSISIPSDNLKATYADCKNVDEFAIRLIDYSNNPRAVERVLDRYSMTDQQNTESRWTAEELQKRVCLQVGERLSLETKSAKIGYYIPLENI